MSAQSLSFAVWAVNAITYVAFVVRRRDGGLFLTTLVVLLLGPLAWFVWLAQRAGTRRASKNLG